MPSLFMHIPGIFLYLQMSLFLQGHQSDWIAPAHMASFAFITSESPFLKHRHILRFWGLELQHMHLEGGGGHNSVITSCEKGSSPPKIPCICKEDRRREPCKRKDEYMKRIVDFSISGPVGCLGEVGVFGWESSWHPSQTNIWAATCSAHEHGWCWADRPHFIFFPDSKKSTGLTLPASKEHSIF